LNGGGPEGLRRYCGGVTASYQGIALVALTLAVPRALAGPGDVASCTGLTSLKLNNTTVSTAIYVPPAGGTPGYCEINATVGPQTDITVRMPDLWYQRYLQLGGGGFDGNIPPPRSAAHELQQEPHRKRVCRSRIEWWTPRIHIPWRFVCGRPRAVAELRSGKIQDTDVVARAAIATYYGKPAKYRYFAGCSNGGKKRLGGRCGIRVTTMTASSRAMACMATTMTMSVEATCPE